MEGFQETDGIHFFLKQEVVPVPQMFMLFFKTAWSNMEATD